MKEPYRSLPVGERWRRTLQAAAHHHRGWLKNHGRDSGEPGPLDDLIRTLETCLEVARRDRAEAEESAD